MKTILLVKQYLYIFDIVFTSWSANFTTPPPVASPSGRLKTCFSFYSSLSLDPPAHTLFSPRLPASFAGHDGSAVCRSPSRCSEGWSLVVLWHGGGPCLWWWICIEALIFKTLLAFRPCTTYCFRYMSCFMYMHLKVYEMSCNLFNDRAYYLYKWKT